MESELNRFVAMCKSMGIPYEIIQSSQTLEKDRQAIAISQAIFYFDLDGVFIGVEDDEMGNFRERVN